MPRKKDVKDAISNNNVLKDIHPRLQLNFFRNQVMVYYSIIEPTCNEIESCFK